MWVWMVATGALADVVGPPPDDCPPGARGTSSHGGPYCVPYTCAEAACGADEACEPAGLCVFEEERPCGGYTTPDSSCTFLYREALGPCESQADCVTGTCEIADRCVAVEKGGLGCSTVGPAPWLGLALLGGAVAARRLARR